MRRMFSVVAAIAASVPVMSASDSITLGGPPSGQAAVYRLATKVRTNVRNRKLVPTFALPRAVALRR